MPRRDRDMKISALDRPGLARPEIFFRHVCRLSSTSDQAATDQPDIKAHVPQA
jgi:hypothetical protein